MLYEALNALVGYRNKAMHIGMGASIRKCESHLSLGGFSLPKSWGDSATGEDS